MDAKLVKAKLAAQKAAEQRAAEQRAAEQRAAEQRAAEQRAAAQRAAEQRAAEQRAAEQRAAELRLAAQKLAAQIQTDTELVKAQNDKLAAQIQKQTERNSTDFQKSNYETAATYKYIFANSVLFWLYYIIVVIVAFLVFRNTTLTPYIKGGLVAMLVIYPFVIKPIEQSLYNLFAYVYAILTGTPYERKEPTV
jgi:hypothetical protein